MRGIPMFSSIRKRLTFTNVAMTLVLVFVMTGGAFAAGRYVITSTRQISPKVLKSLKGANGANGIPGAAGPQGAPGAAGKEGPEGKQGQQGEKGPAGEKGPEGKQGPKGEKGTTGYTKTLPSKESEFGQWGIADNASENEPRFAEIAFPIPLAEEVPGHVIGVEEGEGEPNESKIISEKHLCGGTFAAPKAAPGNFCLFESFVFGVKIEEGNTQNSIVNAETKGEGVGRTGVLIEAFYTQTGLGAAYGTWAVTAK